MLIANGVCRGDVAVVLDLSGPESIAVAAALGSCFDPVFVLANWPHPLGVVPAHHTLGAALYYLPAFARQRGARPLTAPPVFVLDRRRLSTYADDAGQFDNRYLAGLPPIGELRAAGIRHLLYVTPDDGVTQEMDDLNDDLVAIDEGGVDVKMLALSDFASAPLPGWPAMAACQPVPPAQPTARPPFYFGGSPEAHSCFPSWYGWLGDAPPPVADTPSSPLPSPPPSPPYSPSFSFSSWHSIPPRLAPRCRFHPTLRATFAIGGHGGGPHSTWRGASSHAGFRSGFRSGSMGRMHSGGFG